ncbi:hypothetical protein BKA64DRAFT_743874 [Cadophora sp. MPI-SDFR-AT-0126]|nr:hypothetical protein BKA64DRAFT_743874 [Leotiomycetes sp. MPI-SDFR-AT-0126]
MASLDDTTQEPIVFKARGMENDTRLRVFDIVFHVSSAVLKMHSQYFFKFLDSADKAFGSGHGDFKYDWVTKIVDEGDDWQLVCAGPNAGELNLSQWDKKKQPHDKYMQKNAFHNILKAMYTIPYVLPMVQGLLIMTGLARFYMCLPLVSRTLEGAIATSPIELRNKALFKDSLIYCLGPFSNPSFERMTDKKLRKIAQSHHHKLRSTVFKELHTIIYSWIQEIPHRDTSVAADDTDNDLTSAWFKRGLALEAQRMDHGHEVYLPRLFRGMLEDGHFDDDFFEPLQWLLKNDLTIGSGILEHAGEGIFKDFFLFSTIDDDDDYPWDTTVDDW